MNLNIGGDNNGRYKVKKRDRNPFCNGSSFYKQPALSTLWRPEYAPGRNFNTLASLGALKNLDMLVGGDKEFGSNVFYSSVYKAGQYEGSQYALPMECNPTLMFVNKTLLQKEGIKVPDNDWTWDDFYDICKTIVKDSDGDGQMDQFGCYDYTWLQAVYSNGITPFNQSGTSSNFLDEKFSQSLEFVKRLEATNRNYQVTSNDFDLGKVAFRPFTFSDYRTYMPYPWRIKKYSGFEWTCIRMPAFWG